MNTFELGNFTVGSGDPFFILGPCGLEQEDFAWRMARALKEIADRLEIKFVFKASYDKANRTSVDSYRGPGVQEGCRILGEIGKDLGVPVTTDVHTPEEIEVAAKSVVDSLEMLTEKTKGNLNQAEDNMLKVATENLRKLLDDVSTDPLNTTDS